MKVLQPIIRKIHKYCRNKTKYQLKSVRGNKKMKMERILRCSNEMLRYTGGRELRR